MYIEHDREKLEKEIHYLIEQAYNWYIMFLKSEIKTNDLEYYEKHYQIVKRLLHISAETKTDDFRKVFTTPDGTWRTATVSEYAYSYYEKILPDNIEMKKLLGLPV